MVAVRFAHTAVQHKAGGSAPPAAKNVGGQHFESVHALRAFVKKSPDVSLKPGQSFTLRTPVDAYSELLFKDTGREWPFERTEQQVDNHHVITVKAKAAAKTDDAMVLFLMGSKGARTLFSLHIE